MKTLNMKYIMIILVAFFALVTNDAVAQKGKKEKPAKKEKTAKVKPAPKSNTSAALVSLSGMNREEKNTMSKCPVHNKRMGLSDNYRADASDYTEADEYPFAYQLNYRRYCKVCTRVMSKDDKGYKDAVKESNDTGATFERCSLHNSQLKGNPDFDPTNSESNPNVAEMPHARQYSFSKYCKVCTKVHKIQSKGTKSK